MLPSLNNRLRRWRHDCNGCLVMWDERRKAALFTLSSSPPVRSGIPAPKCETCRRKASGPPLVFFIAHLFTHRSSLSPFAKFIEMLSSASGILLATRNECDFSGSGGYPNIWFPRTCKLYYFPLTLYTQRSVKNIQVYCHVRTQQGAFSNRL